MDNTILSLEDISNGGTTMTFQPSGNEGGIKIIHCNEWGIYNSQYLNKEQVSQLFKFLEEHTRIMYCGRSTIDGAYVSGLYTNVDGNKISGIPVHPWSIGRMINPELKTLEHKEKQP
jgi:hypothetical protein